MSEIEAIILAGGNGSRMKELTAEKQKCLLPIEGKPAIGYIMESLIEAFGSVDLKIGISYKGEQVADYVDKNKPKKVTVTYVPHQKGTEGWGIYKDMADHVKGTFVAMPGDILALPEGYEQVAKRFSDELVDATMTLSPQLDEVDSHGVGRISNHQVVELQWPPPDIPDADHMRDMTIWASDRRFFDLINRYPHPGKSIGYVFMDAIKDGHSIAGNRYDMPWVHIGYPKDLQKPLPRSNIIFSSVVDKLVV